ncbi:lipid IV(A) 3-deoxy-D-manno-octulosonic acid transferase [Pistricoccus aurantiacus]|uniref:lipid IV(A) 3-deoxy-D-manno-octulosonic acid transferase n=1 Tax=Pistricoccus aurantiacus TaxID=1883414 RepID=UPI00362867F6
MRLGVPGALYRAALYVLSPLIWKRVWREQLPGRSRGERLGYIPRAESPLIWLHCASVGEVQAARPLIEALLDAYPDHRLTVTTMTTTGAERVGALAGQSPRLTHHFLPLDFPGAAKRFLARLDPQSAIFFETELWPNLLTACAARRIPVAVVNARLSAKAYERYRRIRPLMRRTLAQVDWLAAKSPEDLTRFQGLGMPEERATVVGSLKYDLNPSQEEHRQGRLLRQRLGERPVWVAGSTHQGEDELLLDAHRRLIERHPQALLILVPRHPQRFAPVAELCREQRMNVVLRSSGQEPAPDTRVYLGDTMGELLRLYAAADIAFVGGSLVPIGGHNLLEPAAMGVPVITGPHLDNFSDIAATLHEANALVEVPDAQALAAALQCLFDNEPERQRLCQAAQQVVDRERGALGRIMIGLERLLSYKC